MLTKKQFAIGRILEKEHVSRWIVDFDEAKIASVLTWSTQSCADLEFFVYGSEIFDIKIHLTNFVTHAKVRQLNFISFCPLPDYTSGSLKLVVDDQVFTFRMATEIKDRVTTFQESFKKELYYNNIYIGYVLKSYARECK